MEGKGSIRLDNKDYDVSNGAGVYLGPSETATIQPSAGASLKLFHLVVPQDSGVGRAPTQLCVPCDVLQGRVFVIPEAHCVSKLETSHSGSII